MNNPSSSGQDTILRRSSRAFDALTPDLVMSAVEEAFGIRLDGSFFTYPSYINRVFGLRSESGERMVVKFYRPGRWSVPAIREEHAFLAELDAAEVPVCPPLPDLEADTLPALELETDAERQELGFALFRSCPGKSFSADGLEDMTRLGSLAGRIHAVGQRSVTRYRPVLSDTTARTLVKELLRPSIMPEDCLETFGATAEACAEYIDSRLALSGMYQRLHGDFHRGNILDRQGSQLIALDFDDLCFGPAVFDIWMLLPAPPRDCPREVEALMLGYRQFADFADSEWSLVPALQLLRMLHFIRWQSRQRYDTGFATHFPGWGSRAFWQQEREELATRLADALDYSSLDSSG